MVAKTSTELVYLALMCTNCHDVIHTFRKFFHKQNLEQFVKTDRCQQIRSDNQKLLKIVIRWYE